MADFENTRINPFVNLNNIITEVSLCLNKTNSFHIPYPCGWDKRLVLLTENFPFQPSLEFQVDLWNLKYYKFVYLKIVYGLNRVMLGTPP